MDRAGMPLRMVHFMFNTDDGVQQCLGNQIKLSITMKLMT